MGESKKSSPPRLAQLDFLRGVAILLVLGAHPGIPFNDIGPCLPVAEAWHFVGWTGVDLFFVLSGFLIAGLLFSEARSTGKLDVRRFLIRRTFKIWPCYYCYLLMVAVLLLRFDIPLRREIPYFLHVQNYFGDLPNVAGHTWSLGIEEHFYLVLPLLLAVTIPYHRLGPGLAVFLLLATACAAMRALSGAIPPAPQTHLRIDSLAFGVLLALLYHQRRELFDRIARHRLLLLGGGALLVLVACSEDLFNEVWRAALVPTAVFVGYGAIVMAVVASPDSWFAHPVLAKVAQIGFYSYPIYLWHIDAGQKIVFAAAASSVGQSIPGWLRWLGGSTLYALMAIGAGMVMSKVIEVPALALRDRLFPRRGGPLFAAAAEGPTAGEKCEEATPAPVCRE